MERLSGRSRELADLVVARHREEQPHLLDRFESTAWVRYRRDVEQHLLYLAQAVVHGEPGLFRDYVAWLRILLARIGVPVDVSLRCFELMSDVVAREFGDEARPYVALLRENARGFADLPTTAACHIGPDQELAREYLQRLLRLDRHGATRLVLDEFDGTVDLRSAYADVFQPVLHEVGRLWHIGALTVAQEHYCTAVTQSVVSLLYPRLSEGTRDGPQSVFACVGGELHELGARFVADHFEMDGWQTVYLGASTPTVDIVRMLHTLDASVLGVSVTMVTHLQAAAELIATVRDSHVGKETKILVGGHAFRSAPDLWSRMGADAFAMGAAEAVEVGRDLVG